MSREEFSKYVAEILAEYEKTRNAIFIESSDDYELAREIVDEFMMNTTHIHDDEELSKTEYFVIRQLRDSLHQALIFIVNK